ncbi:MFS transporter [Microbispora bryophytorum]|uniref:MFS transporter n=1 Tax=Microbispora bryophytorum TaxID=1460882 RepID=UPI0033E4C2AD
MADFGNPAASTGGERPTIRDVFGRMDPRAQRIVLICTFAAAFLSLLDATIIGTALPKIVEQLDGDQTLYTWTVTGYLLTSTVTAPLYGRYSDLHGRRTALLISLGIFLLGSVLSGLAQSLPFLIVFRTLQGVGAGGLLPVAMAFAREAFPMEAIGKLQSAMGTMIAVSLMGGPYVGGLLTDFAGWRSVFFINLLLVPPIIAVVALLMPRFRAPDVPSGRADVRGALLFMSGLSLILFGLTQKGRTTDGQIMYDWLSPPVAGCLVLGVVLIGVFVQVERHTPVPLLPLELFHNRTFSAVLGASGFFSMAMFPAVLFMPLYFQQVRDISATVSALLLFPLLLGMVLSNRYSVPMMWRPTWAKPVLVAAAALLGVGSALSFTVGAQTPLALVVLYLTFIGVGIGPSMAGVGLLAQNSVPPTHIGTATSTLMLTKTVGHTLGLAIGQTLFSALLQSATTGPAGPQAGLSDALTMTVATVGFTGAVLAGLSALFMRPVTIRRPGGPPKPDLASQPAEGTQQ